MVRLGDVFERQITGEWGSECLENETGTNILRTTNFTSDGVINYNNVVVRSIEKSKVESKRLHYGDIILEKSGGTDKTPVGRVVFCDPYIETGTYLCNNFTQAMRVNPSMAVPKSVFYFMWNLLWSSKTELMQNKTTGIRNLHVKSYLNQALPLPSLDEQRRIAAMLDKVTDLIFKRRQQLDKLDELIKSRFVEMFGDPGGNPAKWKMERAEKHIDLLSGFPFDSTQYTQSGVNICGGLIIMPQRINWNDCKHWGSIVGYEEYSLQENDIVIALDRPWISDGFKIAMVDKEHLPALLIQRTARIRAVDVNQRYLMYCFMLGSFDAHCNITGSLVPHISPKDIKSFLFMIPPIELQNQFATFVEESEKTQTAISRSLEKLETLKKALMQEYFG